MNIQANALTNCAVVDGGNRLSLGMTDQQGQPVEISVSVSDGCAIAMTLRGLLGMALKEKHRDDSLRHVFPLDNWRVETAQDGTQLIVTLSTGGGFEVSFATVPDVYRALGSALSNEALPRRAATRLPS